MNVPMRSTALAASGQVGEERPDVDHLLPHLDLGLDASSARPLGEARRIVHQHLRRTNQDQDRRQPSEVGIERRSVGRLGIALADVAPGILGARLSLHQRVERRLAVHRSAGLEMVGDRRHADRRRRQRQALVAQRQQRAERQPAARRVTGDGDRAGRHALVEQPAIARDRIVDGGGKPVLRRQPLVYRQRPRTCGAAETGHQVAMGPRRSRSCSRRHGSRG